MALRTYRYLRLGMLAVIVLLAVSILLERAASAGCWQTSISAYYHTPVRAVLVSALVVLGVGMVALLGSTTTEDASLNLAGLLAPVVAFVPTTETNSCSVVGAGGVAARAADADQVVASTYPAIDNNVTALLVVVGLALVVIALGWRRLGFAPAAGAGPHDVPRGPSWVYLLGFGAAAALWLTGFVVFVVLREEFYTRAHYVAAVLMFALIVVAVFANAFDRTMPAGGGTWAFLRRRSFAEQYGRLGWTMVAAAVGIAGVGGLVGWTHWVIAVEAALIALFAVFWAIQTRELWHVGCRPDGRSALASRQSLDDTPAQRPRK